MRKKKVIMFNEEMEKDMDEIKSIFHQKFGMMPSNTNIMNVLMKAYKEHQYSLERIPRNKRAIRLII